MTGVIMAMPPLDFQVTDTYFVVAHFHYVVFGTVVFAMFAGYYFWWPKLTGRMLDETPGQDPLLDAVHRLPHHLLGPALAGRGRHAPANTRTTCPATASPVEPDLLGRCLPAGRLDDSVPLERLEVSEGPAGQHRRPVGLGPLPGMGHQLPAAAAQLHLPAPDPLRIARPSTCTTPKWPSVNTRQTRPTTASSSTPGRRPAASKNFKPASQVNPRTPTGPPSRHQPDDTHATKRDHNVERTR